MGSSESKEHHHRKESETVESVVEERVAPATAATTPQPAAQQESPNTNGEQNHNEVAVDVPSEPASQQQQQSNPKSKEEEMHHIKNHEKKHEKKESPKDKQERKKREAEEARPKIPEPERELVMRRERNYRGSMITYYSYEVKLPPQAGMAWSPESYRYLGPPNALLRDSEGIHSAPASPVSKRHTEATNTKPVQYDSQERRHKHAHHRGSSLKALLPNGRNVTEFHSTQLNHN
ncbi:unnamed protein product [Dibothriocephalus latus]|uniref:Uncharacterized protein n=1 Tax=Dibothriocephalus latus TaxID=60516 RepID=A0A3P6P8V0_DIBLA|nr:unnamed protein product [Dibothriocephalus latus]